jgi:DNA-binding transcriptional MocR family regulator
MDDQQDHIRRIQQEYIQRDQRLFDTIQSHLPELLELNEAYPIVKTKKSDN